MDKLIYSLQNSILLLLIFSITVLILFIYIIWLLLKSAIARGVEDGIYNAIISLEKNGFISDKITEIAKTSNLYKTTEPSIENFEQKID